jgi:D-arabinose 1-dehydrogenase-like Zn-dependent alcohol dehydrogenase
MKMRAVQATEKGKLELVEREVPEPGRGEVRVRVQACGICHSDVFAVEGLFPGVTFPRIPGHEIAGVVDSLGEAVTGVTVGARVGVGWFGGACYRCEPCRRGRHADCRNMRIPGINFDGGYADYMVCPVDGLALIPDDLTAADAAPLLCAGITTFNALRRAGALAGDRAAILGIGGLGHLAVQYAVKMGFETVAIARGRDKAPLARQLGAHAYIDSAAENPGEALARLGGAKVILSTVTNGPAISAVLPGLAVGGKLVIVGVTGEPMEVSTLGLIGGSQSIAGHASGTSIDSEDTLRFSALTGVRPMIETMKLERAPEAYARMLSGEARFRMVLVM